MAQIQDFLSLYMKRVNRNRSGHVGRVFKVMDWFKVALDRQTYQRTGDHVADCIRQRLLGNRQRHLNKLRGQCALNVDTTRDDISESLNSYLNNSYQRIRHKG